MLRAAPRLQQAFMALKSTLRYQYGFMTPQFLRKPDRCRRYRPVLSLSEVAGNQSRFLFDFSPDSIILRWTDDFAPRILYGFSLTEDGTLTVPDILRRVDAGDIKPDELIVGGRLAGTPDGGALRELGAHVFAGVRSAGDFLKELIRADLNLGG